MPAPDLCPTARRIVSKEIRQRVRLSIGPNSRDMLDAGGTVHLTPSEADDAADAAFDALEKVGYVVTPRSRIEEVRAQAIRDTVAGRVTLEELIAAQGVEAVTDTAELRGGGPYTDAEALAFLDALNECRGQQPTEPNPGGAS